MLLYVESHYAKISCILSLSVLVLILLFCQTTGLNVRVRACFGSDRGLFLSLVSRSRSVAVGRGLVETLIQEKRENMCMAI